MNNSSDHFVLADEAIITGTKQIHENKTNASHTSAEIIEDSQTNSQKTRNKSSSPWSATGSINLEDLTQLFGMTRCEAAESLGVSVSTFKRICREYGLHRWPTAKNIRDVALVSQSTNTSLSTLQVKEADSSLVQNMAGNSAKAKENIVALERASTKQYMFEHRKRKQRSAMLPCESPTPNALEGMCQLPENGMVCEDRETSISRQRRTRLERKAGSVDERTRDNRQSSEIVNNAPERLTADSTRKDSSCLTPESASGHIENELDSGAQHSHGDISSRLLGSISCSEIPAQDMKLLLRNLIALPLEELINPETEASMKKVLSILTDDLSSFPEDQAKQLLELKFDFPILLHSWREFSRSQMYNQEFLADLEKTRELAKSSMKDEERLKVRYEELESKEEGLVEQLEAVLKEKASITQQMHEKLKQTMHFVSLAEDRAAKTKEKLQEMRIVSTKLNSLVAQWAKM